MRSSFDHTPNPQTQGNRMETPTLCAWYLAPIQAFFAFTETTFSEENKIPLVKVSEAAINTAEKGAPRIILLDAKIENENTTITEYLHLMEKSVVKLGDFIHDLVDYSKNEYAEIKSSPIDFEPMVKKIWENHGYMEGVDKIEKILTINSKIPFYSDPNRLEIIFGNMISNAIKYHDLTWEHCQTPHQMQATQ